MIVFRNILRGAALVAPRERETGASDCGLTRFGDYHATPNPISRRHLFPFCACPFMETSASSVRNSLTLSRVCFRRPFIFLNCCVFLLTKDGRDCMISDGFLVLGSLLHISVFLGLLYHFVEPVEAEHLNQKRCCLPLWQRSALRSALTESDESPRFPSTSLCFPKCLPRY